MNTTNNTTMTNTVATVADKAITFVGHGLVHAYASAVQVVGQASLGIEQCVRATPDIYMDAREAAKTNVSSILAKYKK